MGIGCRIKHIYKYWAYDYDYSDLDTIYSTFCRALEGRKVIMKGQKKAGKNGRK